MDEQSRKIDPLPKVWDPDTRIGDMLAASAEWPPRTVLSTSPKSDATPSMSTPGCTMWRERRPISQQAPGPASTLSSLCARTRLTPRATGTQSKIHRR